MKTTLLTPTTTRKKPVVTLLVALPALMLTLSSAKSVTLLSDNFTGATLNGSGLSQTVTSGANTYSLLTVPNGFNGTSAGALTVANTGNALGYIGFAPVTLTNVNDYITLSYTVTYPTTPTSAVQGLRFGLYNTSGNINTALAYNAGTNPVGDTATGYFVGTNPGAAASGANNLTKDLGNQLTTSGNSVNGGAAGSTAFGASTSTDTVFGTTPQAVSLTITKTSATQLTIAASVAGKTFSYVNAPTSGYFTYDTFFFSNGSSAGAWQMDNLSITSSVPEPNSAALLGLAGTTLLIFRRRSSMRRAS